MPMREANSMDDVIERLNQALHHVEIAYADWKKLRAELLPPDPGDENPPENQENPIDDTAN